jgi:hypothetical protein
MTREELINYLKGNGSDNREKREIDCNAVSIRYGKHVGRTVGDLINGTKDDVQYLAWLRTNTKSEFMKDVITKATNKKLAELGIEPKNTKA